MASKKTAQFFHTANQQFESLHTDETIRALSALREDSAKKLRNLLHKSSQKKLYEARKLEREILQKESSQKSISPVDSSSRSSFSLSPETVKEITLKKSISFMDPGKTEKLCPDCLYSYQNMPDKQLKILLRPSILKADRGISFCEF